MHEEPDIVELIGSYDTTLTRHIFESFVATAQITLHVRVLSGRNAHHVVESQFKAVARALRDAVALDALLREVDTGSEGLQAMYADLAAGAGLYVEKKTAQQQEQGGKKDKVVCPKCGFSWSQEVDSEGA